MTRKEVIRHLECLSVCSENHVTIAINSRDRQAIDTAIKALEEPERKKGKWLPDNNNYYEERFICSVCGNNYKVDICCGEPMWNFCPCGADMRGEDHD